MSVMNVPYPWCVGNVVEIESGGEDRVISLLEYMKIVRKGRSLPLVTQIFQEKEGNIHVVFDRKIEKVLKAVNKRFPTE